MKKINFPVTPGICCFVLPITEVLHYEFKDAYFDFTHDCENIYEMALDFM